MKTLLTAAMLLLSASAMAYQPPIYINQIGDTSVITQGTNTVYCNRIGNTVVCN